MTAGITVATIIVLYFVSVLFGISAIGLGLSGAKRDHPGVMGLFMLASGICLLGICMVAIA